MGVRSWNNDIPESKVYGANMGPTWVLSAPDGSHVGPLNFAIRDVLHILPCLYDIMNVNVNCSGSPTGIFWRTWVIAPIDDGPALWDSVWLYTCPLRVRHYTENTNIFLYLSTLIQCDKSYISCILVQQNPYITMRLIWKYPINNASSMPIKMNPYIQMSGSQGNFKPLIFRYAVVMHKM